MPSYSPLVDPRLTVAASVVDPVFVGYTFADNTLPMLPSDRYWLRLLLEPPVSLVAVLGATERADSRKGSDVDGERPGVRLVHHPGPGKRVVVSA